MKLCIDDDNSKFAGSLFSKVEAYTTGELANSAKEHVSQGTTDRGASMRADPRAGGIATASQTTAVARSVSWAKLAKLNALEISSAANCELNCKCQTLAGCSRYLMKTFCRLT